MVNWSIYEKRLKINGNTLRDRQIDFVVNSINENFQLSPSYFDVSINGSSILTGVQIVDNTTNASEKVDNIRKVIMKPGDVISIGDLIEWNGKTWLCVSAEMFSDIYWYGTIQECTGTLKYHKTSISSQVYDIPCVVTDKLLMANDENKYFTTLSDDLFIFVADNEITQTIEPDDIFKIGKWNWKVQGINDVVKPGLLRLKMEITEQPQVLPTFGIKILNGTSLRIDSTQALTINCEVTENGVHLSPTPTVIFSSSNPAIATIDNNGVVDTLTTGTVVLTAKLEMDQSVSASITVNVTMVTEHNYTVEISGNSSIVKGKSATYTCKFYDNGILINENSVFELVADDGVSPTSLATITSQDSVNNSCVITANSKDIGYVKLKVRSVKQYNLGVLYNQVIDYIYSYEPLRIQIRNVF